VATQYDWTTLARAAARLQVSESEGELPAVITAASRALSNVLGYPAHLREEVVETVAGAGGAYVWLKAGQVRQLRAVSVYGQELPTEAYALDSARHGRVVRRGGLWPFTGSSSAGVSSIPLRTHDTGDIAITFDAGWVTPGQVALTPSLERDLPEDLEEAALLTVTAWWRRRGRDTDVQSESLGDASLSYLATRLAVPQLAAELVSHYRMGRP
jgi:hypothetical protein